MADNEVQEPPQPDETPLKPKVKRNFTPEQRAALAERMRKVNEERVAKARVKNEAILEAKEAKTVAKLEEIKAKKEKVTKAKEIVASPETPKPKVKKVIKKTVVVQESSDSEEYGSTDGESDVEEEVVYIQKKAKAPKAPKAKPAKLMKEKAPSQAAPKQAEPKVVFRFV